jgi:hypothetical protein
VDKQRQREQQQQQQQQRYNNVYIEDSKEDEPRQPNTPPLRVIGVRMPLKLLLDYGFRLLNIVIVKMGLQ